MGTPLAPVPERSLWLELRFESRLFAFEFQHDPVLERAVVVGSLLRADVQIPKPGVAPVHFHFEREADSVWLIPAYRTDIRVNAARVNGPCCLTESAIIEFAGLALDARVLHTAPVLPNASVSEPDRYTPSASTDAMTCVAVAPATAAEEREENADTARVEPYQAEFRRDEALAPAPNATTLNERALFSSVAQPVEHTERMSSASQFAHITPGESLAIQTERIVGPLFSVPVVNQRRASSEPSVMVPSSRTERIPVPVLPAIAPNRVVEVPVAPSQPEPDATFPRRDSPTEGGRERVPESMRAHLRESNWISPLFWLERLGLLAQRRPLAVATGAAAGALLLTVALVGASRTLRKTNQYGGDAHSHAPSGTSSPVGSGAPLEPGGRSNAASPITATPVAADASSATRADSSAAVAHLFAGRHAEAQSAYAALAGDDPAYRTIARLLARSASTECTGKGDLPAHCPEVKR